MLATLTTAECRKIAKLLQHNIDYTKGKSTTEMIFSCTMGELYIKGYYSDGEYCITSAECITDDNSVLSVVESDLEEIEREVARI